MSNTPKLQASGNTERKTHTASVKASDVYGKGNGWLIGLLIAVSIVALGALAALASGSPEPTPTPVVETVKPVEPKPAVQDQQNNNTNDADHGSVNINGDNNTVTVDNTVTEHHHHHETERVIERVTVIEKPVYRTEIVKVQVQVERRVDNVSAECETHMAEHHERVAGWYRTIANAKRGR